MSLKCQLSGLKNYHANYWMFYSTYIDTHCEMTEMTVEVLKEHF